MWKKPLVFTLVSFWRDEGALDFSFFPYVFLSFFHGGCKVHRTQVVYSLVKNHYALLETSAKHELIVM